MARVDGKAIKYALDASGITQAEAAQRLGTTRDIVANYITGRTKCPEDVVTRIAEMCNVSSVQLFYESMPASRAADLYRLRPGPTGRLRIVGSASAGPGSGDHPDYDELEGVPIDLCREDYIGMSVQGDSMLPLLHPGDVAVFKEHHIEKYGYVWLIRKPDSTIVVKRMVFDEASVKIESLNANYRPERASGIELLGYLVGIWRIDGPETTTRHNPYGIKP